MEVYHIPIRCLRTKWKLLTVKNIKKVIYDKDMDYSFTHNMRDALKYGNRLIMMCDGKIIFDVEGEEKKKLEVKDLLEKFNTAGGIVPDSMMLG